MLSCVGVIRVMYSCLGVTYSWRTIWYFIWEMQSNFFIIFICWKDHGYWRTTPTSFFWRDGREAFALFFFFVRFRDGGSCILLCIYGKGALGVVKWAFEACYRWLCCIAWRNRRCKISRITRFWINGEYNYPAHIIVPVSACRVKKVVITLTLKIIIRNVFDWLLVHFMHWWHLNGGIVRPKGNNARCHVYWCFLCFTVSTLLGRRAVLRKSTTMPNHFTAVSTSTNDSIVV